MFLFSCLLDSIFNVLIIDDTSLRSICNDDHAYKWKYILACYIGPTYSHIPTSTEYNILFNDSLVCQQVNSYGISPSFVRRAHWVLYTLNMEIIELSMTEDSNIKNAGSLLYGTLI